MDFSYDMIRSYLPLGDQQKLLTGMIPSNTSRLTEKAEISLLHPSSSTIVIHARQRPLPTLSTSLSDVIVLHPASVKALISYFYFVLCRPWLVHSWVTVLSVCPLLISSTHVNMTFSSPLFILDHHENISLDLTLHFISSFSIILYITFLCCLPHIILPLQNYPFRLTLQTTLSPFPQ